MNILYVAFPCDPYVGSESKIGWNIPFESEKRGNNVIVATIKDMKPSIDDYLSKNADINIKFYYVDLPSRLKKALVKLTSVKLNLYHARILKLIRNRILKENKIDIIHQITPLEFRSIGNYYKFKDIRFVAGPVGGGEFIDDSLSSYANEHKAIELIRKALNSVSKAILKSNKKKLAKTTIIFANNETRDYLNLKNKNNPVITELGLKQEELYCSQANSNNDNDKTVFIVAGRLVYRKGHQFLLDVLKTIPEKYDYCIRIVGDGEEYGRIKNAIDSNPLLKKHIELVGNVDFEKMNTEYDLADALIMPSLRETSGNVLIEAMSRGVPVITIRKYGALLIVDDSCGYFYDGNSRDEIIADLRNCIIKCIEDKEILKEKSNCCLEKTRDLLFSNKILEYEKIYEELI